MLLQVNTFTTRRDIAAPAAQATQQAPCSPGETQSSLTPVTVSAEHLSGGLSDDSVALTEVNAARRPQCARPRGSVETQARRAEAQP